MSATSPAAERSPTADACLELADVSFVRDGTAILSSISWAVHPGEHWIVLGPNGCGKSTLLRMAGLATHPTAGEITVLGSRLGRIDIRPLRSRIGTASAALADQLRPDLTANEVVICGLNGALEPWWHTYTEAKRERADQLLADLGLAGYGPRRFGSLSSGERQRVLLARSLVSSPALLLFDEPNAGLDLGGREDLIDSLVTLASADSQVATVLVTHHVEDIPQSATHLLAMSNGKVLTSGPLDTTLTGELLGSVFGRPIELQRRNGRWSAVAVR